MMRLGIHEIVKAMEAAKTPEDKAFVLRRNDSASLRTLLRYAYDSRIRWILPDGDPPYTPLKLAEQQNSEYILQRDVRTLYLFVEGGDDSNPNVTMRRREQKFVELLEACHPDDSKILLGAKNRDIPAVPEAVVRLAFPGLLPPGTMEPKSAAPAGEDAAPKRAKGEDPVKRQQRLERKRLAARAKRAEIKAARLASTSAPVIAETESPPQESPDA